MEYKEASL
jgi:V-type H+-transporting ATPase subunit D